MKYVLVIYEGAAGLPDAALEGATPLQLARGVHASALLGKGMSGALQWEEGDPLPAEQALAIILGVAPAEARTLRRGPVEAAGTVTDPGAWTYAYRGNFVTTDGQVIRESRVQRLGVDETRWLTETISEHMDGANITLKVTGAGRLAVMFDRLDGNVDDGAFPLEGLPMTSLLDEEEPPASDREKFMRATARALSGHSINEVRLDLGENPADLVWLWGGGAPSPISRPFIGAPLKAVMVTSSPLARGMGSLCGMKSVELGDLWTETAKPDLIGAAELARCIEAHELTVIYAEAPGEAGSHGPAADKVRTLDRLDIHLLSRVQEAMERAPEARVMVTALPPEGAFMEATPVMLGGSRVAPDQTSHWDEMACLEGAMGRRDAARCLACLLGD